MSNFDGREVRPTIKAMFAQNEGDDAILDEAFDRVAAQARHAALADVRRGVEGLPYIAAGGTSVNRAAITAILDAAETP